MILDNEIKIIVTNDGIGNNLSLEFNIEDKFNDIMTCIQMASNTLRNALGEHIKNKGGVTDEELDYLLKNITLKEIYGSK